tara:strand:+ start:13 stop:507 length:495 start_codon:yes stop_codon:yes gene_type:complete
MRLKNKISKLIEVIKDTEINEIEISSFWGAQRIKLKKNFSNIVSNPLNKHEEGNDSQTITIDDNQPLVQDIEKNQENTQSLATDSLDVITAPLVGTFYESQKPGEPPFINVGDKIDLGQSLCIIEAMKIFNTIESDFSGEIVEILVKDGEPVEFGQPLFKFIKK